MGFFQKVVLKHASDHSKLNHSKNAIVIVPKACWKGQPQEDRKERAKHGLEGDDENLMAELKQMEAACPHPTD